MTAFFDLRLFPLFGLPRARRGRTSRRLAVSATPEATGMAAGTELLERAISYTRGSLALVTPGGLSRPTPCTGWDLAELLVHMDDSLAALLEAVLDRRVLLVPARRPGDDSFVPR